MNLRDPEQYAAFCATNEIPFKPNKQFDFIMYELETKGDRNVRFWNHAASILGRRINELKTYMLDVMGEGIDNPFQALALLNAGRLWLMHIDQAASMGGAIPYVPTDPRQVSGLREILSSASIAAENDGDFRNSLAEINDSSTNPKERREHIIAMIQGVSVQMQKLFYGRDNKFPLRVAYTVEQWRALNKEADKTFQGRGWTYP